MIDNEATQPEEEIQIEITDQPDAEPQGSEDELTEYSKRVSRRVNKLNARAREAEERAAAAERLVQEREQQLHQFRNIAAENESAALVAEEEKIKAQESQVDEIFRQAVQSGDADLQSKATTLKNEVAIRKEKLNTAKARRQAQEQQQAQYQTYEQAPQQQPQPQAQEPTQEALAWHEKNPWYGDAENEEHKEATQFAYFTHYNLISEGFEPDSEDYYQALDSRVERAYPNLPRQGTSAPSQEIEQSESQPAVQRVASATNSGRSQTRVKKDGVRFTNSEIDRISGLKPHNMTDEQWLKIVAKEKQKIQAREASR